MAINSGPNPQPHHERRRFSAGFKGFFLIVAILVVAAAIWYAGWGAGTGGGFLGHRHRAAKSEQGNAGPVATDGMNSTGDTIANPHEASPTTNLNREQDNKGQQGLIGVAQGNGGQIMNAPNKQQYIGQHFQVNGVRIEQTAGNDDAFWVTLPQSGGPPLLVVLRSGENDSAQKRPTKGDLVDVSGTVEDARNVRQIVKQFSLHPGDEHRLQQEGIYVQADKVQTVGE
jgi:hypothetical protein